MARIRTVKPEFWTHHIMGRATDSQKCMALALLNHADDEGYFLADPAIVRSVCRPFDEESLTSHGLITDLSLLGWIELCESEDGVMLGRIVKFKQNQIINRPKHSKLKDSWNNHGLITDASLTHHVGKGKEQGTGNRERDKTQGAKPKKAPQLSVALIELPSFVLRDSWLGFIEMRNKIRKPPTERAANMLIKKLTMYHNAGHDVNAILEQSTVNCWQDLYELKADNGRRNNSTPKTFDQINMERLKRNMIEFAGGDDAGPGQEAICSVDW